MTCDAIVRGSRNCKIPAKHQLNDKIYCLLHYKKVMNTLDQDVMMKPVEKPVIKKKIIIINKTTPVIKPIKRLKDQNQDQNQDQECPICFSNPISNDIRAYLDCGHGYCNECIGHYLDTLGFGSADIDESTGMPFCPGCKMSGTRQYITENCIQCLQRTGHVTEECVQRLQMVSISTLLGEKIYSCINCKTRFTVDKIDQKFVDGYRVTCPTCHVMQCASCNIKWDDKHLKMGCKEYQQMLKPIDAETAKYLSDSGVVACTGPCGHGLMKTDGCNVMRCKVDKLYICGLCGIQLDSSKFSMVDPDHTLANAHYWDPKGTCYNALFMDKKDWLASKAKKTAKTIPKPEVHVEKDESENESGNESEEDK